MPESKKSKRLAIIIPIVVAVLVIIVLAVSGNITKKSDEENPTAQTSVSVVNSEESSETDETSTSEVTLIAVGDNLIHNTIIASGEQDDGSLDYTSLYANIKSDIEKFDIAVINQETILGGDSFEYSGYPTFNSPWEIGDAAIDAGFDVFTCATNHTMDMGWEGIEKEIEYFSDKKNVVQVGVNSSSDRNITYYEKNGITFSFLNYTYGTNGISLPQDKTWCVNLLDEDVVTADIKEARENSDVVIVFPHWGTENSHEVSDYQKEYVELFSELGVDIVIGTHPHVLQSVEWVTNDDTGKKMLVYYSLGNFISHQIQLDQLCGGMAEITIEKNGDDIEISSAKIVPVICHYKRGDDDKYEFSIYKLGDYTDELASSHAQSGGTVEYYTELVNDIIDEEFISMK
ncbi:MAG: CapA family protein [Clostridiales bacterium]|nr:CapA family protein [Clostridiales bacterium]